jgi:hypothetical protein
MSMIVIPGSVGAIATGECCSGDVGQGQAFGGA